MYLKIRLSFTGWIALDLLMLRMPLARGRNRCSLLDYGTQRIIQNTERNLEVLMRKQKKRLARAKKVAKAQNIRRQRERSFVETATFTDKMYEVFRELPPPTDEEECLVALLNHVTQKMLIFDEAEIEEAVMFLYQLYTKWWNDPERRPQVIYNAPEP